LYKYGTLPSGDKNSIVQLPLQTWKHIVKTKLKRLRKSLQSFIFHIESIPIITNGNIINIFKSLKQQLQGN
jgi:hypothetical protein